MDRKNAIQRIGLKAVCDVESKNLDFAAKESPYLATIAFSAATDVVEVTVYVENDEYHSVDELDQIDWDEAFLTADYMIID